MKIAYLSNTRFPNKRAHSVQVAHMCQAFCQVGATVDLYVNSRHLDESEKIEDFLNFQAKFKVVNILPSFFLPKLKWTFYLGEFIFSGHFLLMSRSKGYDIIFSRHEWVLFFLLFFLPAKKIVWESHEAKYNWPAKVLLRKGVTVVCISEGIVEDYVKKGISEKQLLVSHDAVDETFFTNITDQVSARKELGLPIDKKIVMYIGGLDGWKGVGTFFSASEILPEVLFVVIGGQENNIIVNRKKYPKVLFLGSRPYKNLPTNQQAADILVIPNTSKNKLSEQFTSPLKLFAHMTSGIPLVVSNIASLTRVVSSKYVTFFEADSTSDLAKMLSIVFQQYQVNKTKAQELQKESVRYTWNNRAQSIINFIYGKR